MSDKPFYGHAAALVRQTLLDEVAKLKATLPESEAITRNLAAIEKNAPVEKMNHEVLCGYVDLLARSQP